MSAALVNGLGITALSFVPIGIRIGAAGRSALGGCANRALHFLFFFLSQIAGAQAAKNSVVFTVCHIGLLLRKLAGGNKPPARQADMGHTGYTKITIRTRGDRRLDP